MLLEIYFCQHVYTKLIKAPKAQRTACRFRRQSQNGFHFKLLNKSLKVTPPRFGIMGESFSTLLICRVKSSHVHSKINIKTYSSTVFIYIKKTFACMKAFLRWKLGNCCVILVFICIILIMPHLLVPVNFCSWIFKAHLDPDQIKTRTRILQSAGSESTVWSSLEVAKGFNLQFLTQQIYGECFRLMDPGSKRQNECGSRSA